MSAAGVGSSPPGHLSFIEGMRGVAAFYVALGHVFTMEDPGFIVGRSVLPASVAGVAAWMWHGHFAVAAFIVLSGFCLQLALFNRADGRLQDLRGFLRRRCRRILPPYYACLLLSLPVAIYVSARQEGLPFSQYVPVTQDVVVTHFLLIHNFSPEWMYKINGVLWSIAIEFQLYFVFPLLVWCMWLWRPVPVLLTAGLAWWALVSLPNATKLYVWYAPLFAFGMACAHYAFTRKVRFPLLAVALGAGAMVCGGWITTQTKELWQADTLFGVGVGLWLMAGVTRGGLWTARVFAFRPLIVLGAFSYSLYLMHHPILQIVYVYRPAAVDGPLDRIAYLLAVGLPVALLLCFAFYWVFERPFIGSTRKRSTLQDVAPSVGAGAPNRDAGEHEQGGT